MPEEDEDALPEGLNSPLRLPLSVLFSSTLQFLLC